MTTTATKTPTVPDLRVFTALWMVMLASVVGLFPFTIYSTFLVPIAATAGAETAVAGTLRGLGGVAAFAVGIAVGPVLDRFARHHTSAVALLMLGATSLIGAWGNLPALLVFCVGIGASTALLTPALLATASARFDNRATAARAATMVTAVQSIAAVAAGPVIGAMAWWQGWRGALIITAAVATVLAVSFVAFPVASAHSASAGRTGYLAVFRELARRSGLLALIGIAFARTAAFMGYLAYLAAWYHRQFDMDAVTFTMVWTLSGASFFAGNYLAGKWANRGETTAWLRHLLWAGLPAASAAVLLVFTAGSLPVALVATALMGASHAVVAAAVTSLIVRTAGDLTTATLSLNAAAMSLGVFAGAAAGGIGLALGGFFGVGATLCGFTLLGLALTGMSRRASLPAD